MMPMVKILHFTDHLFDTDLDSRKPVFMVSKKVRFKPYCSAIETSWKIKTLLVASLLMILSNK